VSAAERALVIAIARELGARIVGYYVEAATREAVARNERRTGRAEGAEGGDLHRGQAPGGCRGWTKASTSCTPSAPPKAVDFADLS